jgi:hypothetical protein
MHEKLSQPHGGTIAEQDLTVVSASSVLNACPAHLSTVKEHNKQVQ